MIDDAKVGRIFILLNTFRVATVGKPVNSGYEPMNPEE
jgi:hypothetical protein